MTPKCLNQIIGTNALVRILSHFTVIDQDIISELNETGISHELILNQFKAVGSKFTLFSNPFEIFAKLDLLEPIECILKYDLVKVNVYYFNEIVGNDHLFLISDLSDQEKTFVRKIPRDGKIVNCIERSSYKSTSQVNVVLDNETNEILTIFPGKYAPPFPSDAMDDFTKRNTTLFWNEHCFTRITHSKEIN